MSDYLWKKSDGERVPDSETMEFLAGEDVELDRELIAFDLRASSAHAHGLETLGILSRQENAAMQKALTEIGDDLEAGRLGLDDRFEDGHSAIETWLTERLGEAGARIHTGRSRNDQVAVALRLYMKDRLARLHGLACQLSGILLRQARAGRELPLPGYTHMQRAMPSSVGMWAAGHAEAFVDNAALVRRIHGWLDASPLGTASGFGVNLPLPRMEVARRMGFARLVVNPQYAQNSRGKVELQALSALAANTLDLRRVAWDLSLFTTAEFGFVTLPPGYSTGSSIMPNKSNPDVVELLRAAHAIVQGAQAELQSVLSLPSGYQRDLQATKAPLLRAFRKGLAALSVSRGLFDGLEWNEAAMAAAITPEMFATDRATELAARGTPFRDAYREVAAALDEAQAVEARRSLAGRVSPGAAGDLLLEELGARLEGESQPLEKTA